MLQWSLHIEFHVSFSHFVFNCHEIATENKYPKYNSNNLVQFLDKFLLNLLGYKLKKKRSMNVFISLLG